MDLLPEIERLRQEGSAFVPQSVWIEKSYHGTFDDTPYVESVSFGKLSCPYLRDTFESSFNDPAVNNKSRSGVTYFGSKDKPDCALPTEEKAAQFLNFNEQCAKSVLPNETVVGELNYEPLCLILVIAPPSRKDLFDQLVEAKRPLEDPLRVGVNYVVGLNNNPSVGAIDTNCHNSKNLYTNYLLDTTLQKEKKELEDLRVDLQRLRERIIRILDVNAQQRFSQPPALPPPPPPPPVDENAPPAPPTQVTFLELIAQMQKEVLQKEAREKFLVELVGNCVPTRTHVCGYTILEAPNPWIGSDGTPCRGNATKSARVGDFCSYWDSDTAPDGAPSDSRDELLQAGPWCWKDDANSRAIRCASTSQRTQRSGVSELEYILRPDRRMCEDVFFRTRMTPDQHAVNSAEDCRREIDKRNVTCHETCGEDMHPHPPPHSTPTLPHTLEPDLECTLLCSQIHAMPIAATRLASLYEIP